MSFAIGVEFLTGYSVASMRPGGEPEWPPHPARLFMALAAAHFADPGDSSVASEDEFVRSIEAEQCALKWIEGLDPPSISASDADPRCRVVAYVPANDEPIGKKPGPMQSVAGLVRRRATRTFPTTHPRRSDVYFVWPCACPEGHREAVVRLCRKITRLGHPSSLVQAWVTDREPCAGDWVPDEDRGSLPLRRISDGCLGYLTEQFRRADQIYDSLASEVEQLQTALLAAEGPGNRQLRIDLARRIKDLQRQLPNERFRPALNLPSHYARLESKGDDRVPGTIWDPRLLIFGLQPGNGEQDQLHLVGTLALTKRLHRAVIWQAHRLCCGCSRWQGEVVPVADALECWRSIPEWISGHRSDGAPTDAPHIAYLPLGFVGGQHADAHLMGVAIALPHALGRNERTQVSSIMMALSEEGLKLGQQGVWRLVAEESEIPPYNLRSNTWTALSRGSLKWATVTPMALDRHPKPHDRTEYETVLAELIRQAVGRVVPRDNGLDEIVISRVSAHRGAPAAHEFPRLKRNDGSERRQVHAILSFREPLRGPLVLGAGRYRGYGLCRPLNLEQGE
jgi:CRISPR-associated protein Csb2